MNMFILKTAKEKKRRTQGIVMVENASPTSIPPSFGPSYFSVSPSIIRAEESLCRGL